MSKDNKPIDEELVACDVCLKELPKSEAIVPEATDYIAHYCGLDCYEKWKNQSAKTNNELRHFLRIPFHANVQLHFHLAKEVQTVLLLDISLKGALVEIEQHIVNAFKGKNCRMVLVLGKGGENITMEGKVIHQEGKLMGIVPVYRRGQHGQAQTTAGVEYGRRETAGSGIG